MVDVVKKSVLAGVMIAIGSLIYVNCENKVVGSVFFSIGLLAVIRLGLNLYTGKVGYVRKFTTFAHTLFIFLFNCVGCMVVFPYSNDVASSIVSSKLSAPLQIAFINAIICGILIFVAVQCKDNLITVFSVAGFILCGAEHSVADVCYIIMAKEFTIKSLIFVSVVVVGNAVGSIVFSTLLSSKEDKKRLIKE